MGSSAAIERIQRHCGRLVGTPGGAPISHPGRAPAVLALHGFGGTVRDVEAVVDVARDLGLTVRAPLLPGHGTHASDLAGRRWPDWYDAASEALADLTAAQSPAILVGLSLGSLLAIHLAVLQPERVSAVALLANAAWLHPATTLGLRVANRLRLPNLWTPKLASDIGDAAARRTHTTYRVQPLYPALDVLRAGVRSRALARQLRVPTLIAHGARDRVCPVSNARRLMALVPARDRRVVILPNSRHVITRDVDRRQLRDELHRFLARVAAGQEAVGALPS